MAYRKVPVLGPFLFNIYVSGLFQVVDRHLPEIHSYADDSQLYLSFSPKITSCQDAAVSAMEACIADIKKWEQHNSLMLTDDKTESISIGTRQQLAKVDVSNIRVGNHYIIKSKSVRNLGTSFNDTFDMSQHVTNLCSLRGSSLSLSLPIIVRVYCMAYPIIN